MEKIEKISLIDFYTHFVVIADGKFPPRKPTKDEIERLSGWNDKIEAGFVPKLRRGRGSDKVVWVKDKK